MIIIELLLEMNNFILLYKIILIRHEMEEIIDRKDYRLTVNEIIVPTEYNRQNVCRLDI